MMGLQRFERRLERLVEGAFTKAFRSGLQPVDIGRRIVREMEAGRTLGMRGTVVPNAFSVRIAPEDFARFASFHEALQQELADAAREHARDERYTFEGPVTVEVLRDESMRKGDLRVQGRIVEGKTGPIGTLLLSDGRRIALGDADAIIGRLPDCVVALSDPQVSRHHARIHHDERGYRIVDLGSTNGTQVNGVLVREQALHDGDVILVGATSLRFQES